MRIAKNEGLVLLAALGCAAFGYGASASRPERSTAMAARSSPRPPGIILTGVAGPVASSRLLADVRSGAVAGVVMFAADVQGDAAIARFAKRMQAAARAGHQPPAIIALDQEGGPVKRIRDIPPTLSPRAMGHARDSAESARRQGKATGRALRRLGVNVDLAPVADLPTGKVPRFPGRYFSHSAATAAPAVAGFALGLRDAGVVAVVKHFPGLGTTTGLKTDIAVQRVTASATKLRAGYAPYARIARAGPDVAPIVMLSSAIYPALDRSGAPAALSRRIATDELQRTGLGDRLRMTDDLVTASYRAIPDAPVRAIAAGDDLLLISDLARAEQANEQIVAAVRSGHLSQATVDRAAQRVAALRRTMTTTLSAARRAPGRP